MKIAVIGSGYVGLPLSIAFSKYHSVISYDVNKKRVRELEKGFDCNQQHSKKEILHKKLTFTSNLDLLNNRDVYIVTVPTPIKSNNQPDLTMLKEASILVGKVIKKNTYIIFESTTYQVAQKSFAFLLLRSILNLIMKKTFLLLILQKE